MLRDEAELVKILFDYFHHFTTFTKSQNICPSFNGEALKSKLACPTSWVFNFPPSQLQRPISDEAELVKTKTDRVSYSMAK